MGAIQDKSIKNGELYALKSWTYKLMISPSEKDVRVRIITE